MAKLVETPLMKQYYDIKSKNPDAILLFRVGDFYEMYGDDAIVGAGILGIVQTKRSNGSAAEVAMAGFPFHALDTYLPKLIRAGKRVAICDQLENPKLTNKIVKRGITEIVTPGISISDSILTQKENNFLAAIYMHKNYYGLSLLDISTGEFLTTEGLADYIDKLLNNFAPKEIVIERNNRSHIEEKFNLKCPLFPLDDWIFAEDTAKERLLKHFGVSTLKGFGINEMKCGIITAGAILHYLELTQQKNIEHINKIVRIEEDSFVRMDKFTVRNLEVLTPMNNDGISLLDIIDKTCSPMGSRLLRRWIVFPLKNIHAIGERQEVVKTFYNQIDLAEEIELFISQIGDLERIITKIAVGRVNPRELIQLRIALQTLDPIKERCNATGNKTVMAFAKNLDPCDSIKQRIEREIIPNPPLAINKGGVIRSHVNEDLDELRQLAYAGKDYLLKIQKQEMERTGIPTLKIAFNSVFGYYMEVRNTHKDKVPQDWIRKQTLVNAERYITEELKEYEEKILGAEQKIFDLEEKIFKELVLYISQYVQVIRNNAHLIAQIDCLLAFAKVARQNKYVCPVIDNSLKIDIKGGRHPVIEKQLPSTSPYIANDIYLDNKKQQIVIITGPNMSGKSALLRQTALIVLLAQIGSFVPAESAQIGYIDKIFTRVGASDNISLGESTFMMEMTEAAEIMNNLSERSLILFDELGRGTSTYDGISIAWSIVEYIHENPIAKAKTLFATHYHEINEMEKSFKRIKNFNVSIRETDNKIVFMRKLMPGGSEHSFGIHVAKMAGMPKSIVKRANEILRQLESDNRQQEIKSKPIKKISTSYEGYQYNLFQLDDPVLCQVRDEILHLDINNLTPMEAMNKIYNIKKIITGKSQF